MKVVDEEVGLNHVDRESKNVSDEAISKSESSDEEIYLVRAEKDGKGRKSTWKESKIGYFVDCICSSEYTKNKLIFTNNTVKHQRIQNFITK